MGSRSLIENIQSQLGFKAAHRDVIEGNGSYALREVPEPYGLKFPGENETLRPPNTCFCDESVDKDELGPTRTIY